MLKLVSPLYLILMAMYLSTNMILLKCNLNSSKNSPLVVNRNADLTAIFPDRSVVKEEV